MKAKVIWKNNGLSLEGEVRQHHFQLDTSEKNGGHDLGPSPKEFVLAGIAGCTAMDVISILNKMRFEIKSFEVSADTVTTTGTPSVFGEINVIFQLESPNIPVDRYLHAIELSQTKYCGVSKMIAYNSPILYSAVLNGTVVGSGKALFT